MLAGVNSVQNFRVAIFMGRTWLDQTQAKLPSLPYSTDAAAPVFETFIGFLPSIELGFARDETIPASSPPPPPSGCPPLITRLVGMSGGPFDCC